MNGEKGLMVAGGVVAVVKRRSSFVEGALILGVSGVVTRLIGAFFKIPLGNLLGGSGMGGGTLTGLGMLLLGERDPARIGQLAAGGRADQVDLMMRDLYDGDLPTLSRELTAAITPPAWTAPET